MMSKFHPRTSLALPYLALSLLMLTAVTACNDATGNSAAGAAAQSSSSSGTSGSSGGGSAPPQPTSGSAVISWTAPTTNTNGTALTDLAGYTILYGSSPSTLNQSIEINSASTDSYTISGLAAGTWYFSVIAKGNDGSQSEATTPVSTTIT